MSRVVPDARTSKYLVPTMLLGPVVDSQMRARAIFLRVTGAVASLPA